MRSQFCYFLHLLTVLAILFNCAVVLGQTATDKNKGTNPVDSEGILNQLAPDDAPPPSLALKPAERLRAIRLLVAVKRDETGWHWELAVYLLATLGQDYAHNRDELLGIWRRDGDDGTMELLIRLYEQGHKELLSPLLTGFDGNNVATSEGLGSFYGDLLEKNPRDFLAAITTLPLQKQRNLCYAAGQEDGGGMGPETERKVLANLKVIGGEVAERCTRSVRAGNLDADVPKSDLPAEPPKKK